MEQAREIERKMHEIRVVGRGGHGVVTAGDLIGGACVAEGRSAQSIPTFGPERRGALCSCTVRLSDEPVRLKCGPTGPDVLVVLDRTIWRHAPVALGLQEGAKLLFNSTATPEEIDVELGLTLDNYEIYSVDATGIALDLLGRAITNTTMLGAFVGATQLLSMESIERVIAARFVRAKDINIAAAHAGRDRLSRLGG